MLATIIGLFSLSIIVLIHELGHYFSAIYYKVEVEEFALGLGPKLYSIQKKQTLWSIRLFPLGGFCRMKTPPLHIEYEKTALIPQEEHSFSSLNFRGKATVLLGGPIANIVLFIFLSLLLFVIGNKELGIKSYIEPVASPAKESPLQQGDLITQINDIPILSYTQLYTTTGNLKGQEVSISFIPKNTNTTKTISIMLNADTPALGVLPYISPKISSIAQVPGLQLGDIIVEINGKSITNAVHIPNLLHIDENDLPTQLYILRKGQRIKFEIIVNKNLKSLESLGILVDTVMVARWNDFGEFIQSRGKEAITIMSSTLFFIGDILRLNTKRIMKNTAGPIRLISMVGNNTTSNASQHGWLYAIIQFLNITSLLSLAIASLNLLPIPILDGGQLLFYSYHRIRNRAPKIRSLIRYNTIGGIVLLLLFGLIMFSDILSFF